VSVPSRTVLIATGDRLFAEAVGAYLGPLEGWEVLGTALDGLTALAIVTRRQPSCVLVIGDLPRLGTSALIDRIERRSPQTTVVVVGLGEADDPRIIHPRAGAIEILAALREPPIAAIKSQARESANMARLGSLTSRERSTLMLIADGCTREEIATRMNVSVHTVRTHTQNLYAKLGVHNRLQLARFAARHGLLGDGN
jgi:DNA-binding NarL/FixJ family response regulator